MAAACVALFVVERGRPVFALSVDAHGVQEDVSPLPSPSSCCAATVHTPLHALDRVLDALHTCPHWRRAVIAHTTTGVVRVRLMKACQYTESIDRAGWVTLRHNHYVSSCRNDRIKAVINAAIAQLEKTYWLSTLGGAFSSMGDYDVRFVSAIAP